MRDPASRPGASSCNVAAYFFGHVCITSARISNDIEWIRKPSDLWHNNSQWSNCLNARLLDITRNISEVSERDWKSCLTREYASLSNPFGHISYVTSKFKVNVRPDSPMRWARV